MISIDRCKHVKIKFYPCVCMDRYPGIWHCVDCGYHSPVNPVTGLRFLTGPNPRHKKVLPYIDFYAEERTVKNNQGANLENKTTRSSD